ncbi:MULTISPECIES: DUF2812 domain-containing protein [Shouchella]|uniref:DUF2812 domain-containing protein n=1 Tax=Shouchella TaxID=2893057 RepID=UPI000BA60BFC|nr:MULTISPECIES: DUF2812 domain-containing protein [Shouchella]MCM3380834.1 DUF2812 domain-containing protein [Shouchella rhizosphaerae]PAD14593.1 hypothetical protein CHH73_17475 [Shouchella clausii]PAE79993.1 hypothetical protein CHH77_18095 [Shouchella clausii]PAE91198.1 hypothetical protein CHH70_19905 [Shouchella clausii]
MRQTKYMMSGGLAFSENKDMEKLRQFSLKGWHVSDFKFMGYTLVKGQSADYIYSIDDRSLNEEEAEEYFDFFSSAGWTHIASQGNFHLFRGLPGTKPIYSDQETIVEKHNNAGNSIRWTAISTLLLTVLLWFGTFISSGFLHMTLFVIATILTIIAISTTWTVLAIYNNKWKVEGRKGLVILTKMIPPLLFLVAVIILVASDSGRSVRILAAMVIGAISFPTAIWMIMSLKTRLGGKRA